MRGPQQTIPDLQELKRLWAEHSGIEDFNERIMHGPPDISIPRSCQECGRTLPDHLIGWDTVRWQVEHNEPLPKRMDPYQCEGCEPDEDDD